MIEWLRPYWEYILIGNVIFQCSCLVLVIFINIRCEWKINKRRKNNYGSKI